MTVEAPDARAAYDAWHHCPVIDLETRAPWHALVKAYVARAGMRGEHALEIGCGRGEFSLWLATHVAALRRVVAADLSETALRRGRETALEAGVARVTWAQADVQCLPFPSESFDLVVSCETIEHVPDPGLAVRELARVLRSGGYLILTTPNYLGPIGLYRGYMRLTGRRYTETGQPINRFVIWPRTLRWFRRAGLEVVRKTGAGHYLPVPGRPPVRWRAPDRAAWLTRWFALHTLVVGLKP